MCGATKPLGTDPHLLMKTILLLTLCAIVTGCGIQEAERVNEVEVKGQLKQMGEDIDRLVELTAILAAQIDAQVEAAEQTGEMIRMLRERIRDDQRRQEEWLRYYHAELERIRREREAERLELERQRAAAAAAGIGVDGPR